MDEHLKIGELRAFYHIVKRFKAFDIADLMRIRNDGCGSAGNGQPGIVRDCDVTGFDMNVTVDEPRDKICALGIELLLCRGKGRIAEACDQTIGDIDIPGKCILLKNVDDHRVSDAEIRRFSAGGDIDQMPECLFIHVSFLFQIL